MAKTDWGMDNIVMPNDMNQIGQEINEALYKANAAETPAGAQAKADAAAAAGVAAASIAKDAADAAQVTADAAKTKADGALPFNGGIVANADTLTQPGIYNTNSTFIGSPFVGTSASNQGYLEHYNWGASTVYRMQVHTPINSGIARRYRMYINGTWGAWRTIWDSDNDGAGSGLDADLLDGKHANSFVNSVSIGSTSDPNTTLEPYILTNHANGPGGGYWHIQTLFYTTISTTASRAQFAFTYSQASARMMIRRWYNGTWNSWREVSYGGMDFRVNAGNLEYNDGGVWKKVGGGLSVASNSVQQSFDAETTIVASGTTTGRHKLIAKFIPRGTGEAKISIDLQGFSSGTNFVNARAYLAVPNIMSRRISAADATNRSGGSPIVPTDHNLDYRTPIGTMITGLDGGTLIQIGMGDTTSYKTFDYVVNILEPVPIYVTLQFNDPYNDGWTIRARNVRFCYDIM